MDPIKNARPASTSTPRFPKVVYKANDTTVRGAAAIGDAVDLDSIRNSNHRENYLGHSILARKSISLRILTSQFSNLCTAVGRAERRRDQLFWARDKAKDAEEDELKIEFKEAQIRERRALNEHLGRPMDEGIEELINPKPAAPAMPNPVAAAAPAKEHKERRHKHHHRRHHRSRSPRRHHHRSHRSDRERDRSRSRDRHNRSHHRERERSRSPHERRRRHSSERDHVRGPEERRPRRRDSETSYDRPQRRSRSPPRTKAHGRDDRERERSGSYAPDRHQRSRRDSYSRH